VTKFLVSGFFVKQLLLVRFNTLRKNFDFNTITEELFDFKSDSPIYSQPKSLDFPVYSPLVRFDSTMYSPLGSLDYLVYSSTVSHKFDSPGVFTTRESRPPVYSQPGSQDSPVYSIYYQGFKTP
jgi:hypothetical protein